MKLEICVTDLNSALIAEKGGADRIELCKDLRNDGLTPELETFNSIKEKLKIPIFVLIRPRAGNFVYDAAEFDLMLDQIQKFKDAGAEGIVSGILSSDDSIDESRTRQLIQKARPLPFTFHRAFDMVNDPFKAAVLLKDMGVERILTSGSETSAIDGLQSLIALKKEFGNQPIIMAGGGIRKDSILAFKINGFREVHSAAIRDRLSMKISEQEVQEMRAILDD